jgi:ABC-2 type transport system ATP-binding protein
MMTTPVIEFKNLVKKYRDLIAVDNLSFTIQSGKITGLLGPNGAGKSTALKCLLGLSHATSGEALIHGKSFSQLHLPLKEIGAVIEDAGFNPKLSAEKNLKIVAASSEIDDSRVAEVLEMVELDGVGKKKSKEFSLGMKQRLALAGAMLGEPKILILDEPSNGLDPIGIAWLRKFLRNLADAGSTILISSHLLAEMEHTVDDVVIINRGKMIVDGPIKEVTSQGSLEDAFMRAIEAAK